MRELIEKIQSKKSAPNEEIMRMIKDAFGDDKKRQKSAQKELDRLGVNAWDALAEYRKMKGRG